MSDAIQDKVRVALATSLGVDVEQLLPAEANCEMCRNTRRCRSLGIIKVKNQRACFWKPSRFRWHSAYRDVQD